MLKLVLRERKKEHTPAEGEDELLLGEDGEHEYGSEVAAAFGDDPDAKLKPRPKPKPIEPPKP